MPEPEFNLEAAFAELDNLTEPVKRDIIVRAPFGWPGGKTRSIKNIIEHLPYTDRYVSVFGGSGIDILMRHPVRMEIFNDRFAGITCFYRCVRDHLDDLCDRLELTCYSREEFIWCKETWENCEDEIERAARWYYMVMSSFGRLGRNWGRSTSVKARISGIIRDKLKYFHDIHERFKYVQIENQDWEQLVFDYDHHDTVFYMDPPYVDANRGIYEHELDHEQHRKLIDIIFNLKGFVAISGYSNPLYDNQPWDNKFDWNVTSTIESQVANPGNRKQIVSGSRPQVKECLWIKEAQ
jgi:DNA adenine methylase